MAIGISTRLSAVFIAFLFGFPSLALAVPMLFTDSGVLPADIADTVLAFQMALGNPNNANNPGPLASGRREINWDGGGAMTPTVSGTPLTAFQNIRGALLATPGTGFIQASPADLATQFNNANFSTIFQTFSPLRLFTPIGSNITDVTFFIPGTNGGTPAFVRGFGAVFADVDLASTTSLQFFAPNGSPIGSYFAPTNPVGANNGLSFLGVLLDPGQAIGRVRITTGNGILAPPNGSVDEVVMDDFLYSEPQAVPEPSTSALMLGGLLWLGWSGLRRRKTAAEASDVR